MDKREFINQVIDCVVAQDEAIEELRKEAKAAKSKPAFSDAVLEQTAGKLVDAGLLNKAASESLVQSFRENPEEALLSLQKLAGVFAKRESAAPTLGGPAKPIKKQAAKQSGSQSVAESDKAWEESFGSGANS